MGATFKEIAHKQIQEYMKQWYADAYKQMQRTCLRILKRAVTERRDAPNAHDFTGNLLNSIAVALLCSPEVVKAVSGAETIQVLTAQKDANQKPAEYTGIGFRHGGGGLHDMNNDAKPMQQGYYYLYEWDYEGANSEYRKGRKPAEAEGGAGYMSSIGEWKNSLQIKSGNMFEVHLGYTAPYAEWVELHRKTVGAMVTFEESKAYFEVMGLKQV